MATDILFLGLILSMSTIFAIVGFVERKASGLILVSGVIFLSFAAQLGSDMTVIVDHTSTGANINYTLSGMEVFSMGVIGMILMVFGGMRSSKII